MASDDRALDVAASIASSGTRIVQRLRQAEQQGLDPGLSTLELIEIDAVLRGVAEDLDIRLDETAS